MAKYGISFPGAPDVTAVVKVLRPHSLLSIKDLRTKIEEGIVIELYDSFDCGTEEGYREHQKKIEKYFMSFEEAKLGAQFHYQSSKEFGWEKAGIQMMKNLIDSSIESYYQEHD